MGAGNVAVIFRIERGIFCDHFDTLLIKRERFIKFLAGQIYRAHVDVDQGIIRLQFYGTVIALHCFGRIAHASVGSSKLKDKINVIPCLVFVLEEQAQFLGEFAFPSQNVSLYIEIIHLLIGYHQICFLVFGNVLVAAVLT